jgi:hypothetical protein
VLDRVFAIDLRAFITGTFLWRRYHYPSVMLVLNENIIRRIVAMPSAKIVWEIRPSKHRHTFDLISNALPFGRTCGYHYAAGAVRHAIAYSGSQPAVIRVYDEAGSVVETHEHESVFRKW